jgi:hypothetical protein
MVTGDLGRGVFVSLSVEDDSTGSNETDSIHGRVLQPDAGGNLPDEIGRNLQVFCVRPLIGELSTVNHSGDLIADLEVVRVLRDRRDVNDGSREIASDDGPGNRKTRDRGVLPVGRVLSLRV